MEGYAKEALEKAREESERAAEMQALGLAMRRTDKEIDDELEVSLLPGRLDKAKYLVRIRILTTESPTHPAKAPRALLMQEKVRKGAAGFVPEETKSPVTQDFEEVNHFTHAEAKRNPFAFKQAHRHAHLQCSEEIRLRVLHTAVQARRLGWAGKLQAQLESRQLTIEASAACLPSIHSHNCILQYM
eukprot:1157908-Pelagomonas_calceolata.AAC.2